MRLHWLVFATACLLRGRGFDQLPREVTTQFEGSLVRKIESEEPVRAFRVAVLGLLAEIQSVDADLATRLRETLIRLSDIPV